jgi:hypothetical protein
MHLVKRVFATLVLNAARNDRSAHQAGPPERRRRGVVYPLARFLLSTSSREHGRVSLASADDAGLTRLAYIVGIETELRLEDRVAIFP